ncbi:MAG: hypothetical protein QM755_10625 [Luteolibacter sp.]
MGSLEVVFATDSSVYDGRWIDNGWLQEVPDPVTKLAWDNAALISPKTAKELGLYDEIIQLETEHASVHPDGESGHRKAPIIKVTVNGKTAEFPVLISFGQAENTIVLPLGYGQGFDKDDELDRDTAKDRSRWPRRRELRFRRLPAADLHQLLFRHRCHRRQDRQPLLARGHPGTRRHVWPCACPRNLDDDR